MQNAALVMAHPGHELRIHGWIAQARPVTSILTDGSGLDGTARIDISRALLAGLGASPGPVFAPMTERDAYGALLALDHGLFLSVADDLVRTFLDEDVDGVVADAAEGFHPVHDACRLMATAAVAVASRECGRSIPMFDYAVYGEPETSRDAVGEDAVWLELDETAFSAKRNAACAHPGLAHEVDLFLTRFGEPAFRRECLRRVDDPAGRYRIADDEPVYERYGRALAARGRVERAIGRREHLEPLAAALGRWAGLR
jgi:hypothetical protein